VPGSATVRKPIGTRSVPQRDRLAQRASAGSPDWDVGTSLEGLYDGGPAAIDVMARPPIEDRLRRPGPKAGLRNAR
jgi:hypothetical protein